MPLCHCLSVNTGIEDMTIVRPDGSFIGPKPLTFGIDLGKEYACQ